MVSSLADTLPHIKAGKLIALGQGGPIDQIGPPKRAGTEDGPPEPRHVLLVGSNGASKHSSTGDRRVEPGCRQRRGEPRITGKDRSTRLRADQFGSGDGARFDRRRHGQVRAARQAAGNQVGVMQYIGSHFAPINVSFMLRASEPGWPRFTAAFFSGDVRGRIDGGVPTGSTPMPGVRARRFHGRYSAFVLSTGSYRLQRLAKLGRKAAQVILLHRNLS